MNYVIETFGLTKIFADLWGRARVTAVDGLDLQIRHNEVFGLLGPNGSGKTTTIKMLLGLLHPTRGKYIILGGDCSDSKVSNRIGFLPEESYLYKYLNARETLDFYGRLFGLPSKVRKTRIEALLEMVGLKAMANRPVGTFSKGMARRIGLAQALINDPDLLILDEPTTGLDPIGTRQIKDLILELAKRGKTILLCSHLLADVEDVCDRISILYGGKVQAEGNVRELLQKSNKSQIVTDRLSEQAVEKIRRIVEDENPNFEITSPMEKLETFFINTVAAAQQQQKQTSGAYSTTNIDNFLTAQSAEESILDKLVSATVSGQESEMELDSVDKSEEKKTASQPDNELLANLTGHAETNIPESAQNDSGTEEPKPIEQDNEANTSILDQLTGKNTPESRQREE
ncbi:MAG: ABC transporter ATP-binding protein [Phycisphaerae bacterium]|nr:ABC transporter ATP-binding protein [Phycisphaerae bacterium]